MQQNDLIERLRALYVWPQSVADHHADTLTPRQIERLYAVGTVAAEAADALAQRDATIERLREGLDAIIAHGVERDQKWAGMTARDIARQALQGED